MYTASHSRGGGERGAGGGVKRIPGEENLAIQQAAPLFAGSQAPGALLLLFLRGSVLSSAAARCSSCTAARCSSSGPAC
ncbi:hypothetical protein EYF80_047217 [Liparis tanakae]|uniref:Uncharacterized protein n=1 Tax=Liparis tanakae TaxID=230148 RepID=A0A4Z2FNW1_9TELE|nr:hypothetical protein EYF80_047217 [Liparis tanakae]